MADDDLIMFAEETSSEPKDELPRWKILVADDEQAVHLVTRLALGEFSFQDRKVELLSAYGEEDTKRLMAENPDTALVLLDVVMDTVTSGFDLVRFIREELENREVRIILRTGQSGTAPEDEVIINYDINDFKDKTELTISKLRTTLISSLRAYSHLKIIEEEQKKLAQSKSYLRQIINSLSSMVITLNQDFQVNLWNLEAERWTGIPQAQAVGRVLWEIYPYFEPFHEVIRESLSGWKVFEQTNVPFGPEGKTVVHLSLYPLESGDDREMILRVDDTTDFKRKEELLSRSQRMNALSSLSAGLANQMGGLIEEIKNEAQWITDSGFSQCTESPCMSHIVSMQNASHQAMDLLTRIVSLTRRPDTPRKTFKLDELVARVVGDFIAPDGVIISFKAPSEKAYVFGSEADISEALGNLITNAVHGCTIQRKPGEPQVGTVLVEMQRITMSEEIHRRHPDMEDRPYWLIRITDSGVGMPSEILSKIFDPYFTTKSRSDGVGLGLSLVHNILELHNGFIDLESEKAVGTVVQVFLPEEKAQSYTKGQLESILSTHRGTGTILVCDDEGMMRQIATRILERFGFKVISAADGPSAVELFQDNRDQIRLVILDMLMPGITGLEIFRQLKEIAPDVKVLLSSGFGRGERVEQALAEGVKGFLQKPFGFESLAHAVFDVLEE